jgi:excisionase family DNA binding protein
MTLSELERQLAQLPAGSLVPVDWVREQVRAVEPVAVGETSLADLTVEEAGRALGRSDSTVRDYCRQKLLPGAYRQRGREWRVPRSAIRSFQQAEAAPPASAAKRARPDDREPDLEAWRKERAP